MPFMMQLAVVQPLEALQIGAFEHGVLPDLFELQRIGQYCKSMLEAVHSAQRSAASMVAVDDTVYVVVVMDCCGLN